MYMYINTYIHIYIHTYIHIYIYIYINLHLYVPTFKCLHIYIPVSKQVSQLLLEFLHKYVGEVVSDAAGENSHKSARHSI